MHTRSLRIRRLLALILLCQLLAPLPPVHGCPFEDLAPQEPSRSEPVRHLPQSESRPYPRAEVQTPQGHVVTDFTGDGMVHIQWSAHSPLPSAESPIPISPMVEQVPAKGPRGWKASGQKTETADLKVEYRPEDLSLVITEKGSDTPLVTLRPERLGEDWKTLVVESGMENVYGVGEYPRAGNADRPWVGDRAMAGPHGNALNGFYGGANAYTQFPVIYGIDGKGRRFALFLDQPYRTEWDFTEPGKWKAHMWGDEIRAFLITGESLPELHRKYMELTGEPPVPPKEVFGFGISHFGYRNWREVLNDLEELRRAGIPVDHVALDLFWFGGEFMDPNNPRPGRMGSLDFDRDNFPVPKAMIARLARMGIAVIPISESYVDRHLPEYELGKKWGIFATNPHTNEPALITSNNWWGVGPMIDWSNPASQRWAEEKYGKLAEMGIRFFWLDLGEPEMLPPPPVTFHGVQPGRNQPADVHNLYNLLWAKRVSEGLRSRFPDMRLFTLNRSGTNGLQRHGGGKWGGDTGAGYQELIAHLQNRILNMPMVGIDYYSSDVGGFHRGGMAHNPGALNELYTQWLANSLLLDFPVRPHVWNLNGTNRYLPTQVGHVPSNLANIQQRYEMRPYYYSLAHEAHRQGSPIVAPLVYHFESDPNVHHMGHQAMIGKDLLMGVVASPSETSRRVYLPEGKWVNYHTREAFESPAGGSWVDVPVYRDGNLTLPLFARAGAIVPLAARPEQMPSFQSREARSQSPDLRVRVFADEKESSFKLVEDDGHSNGYTRGLVRETTIRQRKSERGTEVVVERPTGAYTGAPLRRNHIVEVVMDGADLATVHADGVPLPRARTREEFDSMERGYYVESGSRTVLAKSGTRPVTRASRFEFLPPSATKTLPSRTSLSPSPPPPPAP